MNICVAILILFSQNYVLADSVTVKHPDDFHKPFWKSKPDVQKKILDEDLIVVSADTNKIQEKPPQYDMKVVAGGAVKTPLEFTFKVMTDYEKLKEVDEHFKESKLDKDQKTLYIHLEALRYHAHMHLKLNEIAAGPKIKQIHWECIRGEFKGMKGIFQVEEIGRQKSEISMTADYRSETLPLPKVLMGIGLEIVGRQVATKMRQYILDQYKSR